MPKRPVPKQNSEDGSQQLEDIMAWGKRKDNYYQDSSHEQSQLQEQEQQANRIYQNQFQQLDNQDLYEIPLAQAEVDESNVQDGAEDDHHALSYNYLTKEIERIAKLGLNISDLSDSKVRSLLETQIQAYLMALIGLRELKIPFVKYHPLVDKIVQMKQDIHKLKALLKKQEDNDEDQQQEMEQQQQYLDEDQQIQQQDNSNELDQSHEQEKDDQIQEGLKVYQQVKQKHDMEKKIKKQLKQKERQLVKKPAFVQVGQNEGRLASEKILKNRGLIKKRKKVDQNSRVKLRRKFDKASSKRRAEGHFIKQNPGRAYQGERNIKYGRIASTKLK